MPVWLRLAIGGAATLLLGMGLGRFSYTPLMPALIENGALDAAEAGTIGALNLTGYLVGALLAFRIRARWGEAPTLRACLWICLVCLIASIPPWGFAWLGLWRFLLGVAVAVMMIFSLAIVTRAAPPARLGVATGTVFTGVGVGILMAGTLVPALLEFGLAAAWAGLAVVGALAVAVGLWGWGAAGDATAAAAPTATTDRPPITPAVLRLIGAQTMFSIGLIPHTIYWVDYLVRGLDRDIAFGGLHWVLFGLGAASGTYVWGRLADRIGFRTALVLVFVALAGGIALPVLHAAGWALVASSLVVGAQPGFSAIVSGRTHQVVGARHMAQVWRWMALVSGVLQAIGGYAYVALFEAAESYLPVFLIGGTAMALGAVVSLHLRPDAPPRESTS